MISQQINLISNLNHLINTKGPQTWIQTFIASSGTVTEVAAVRVDADPPLTRRRVVVPCQITLVDINLTRFPFPSYEMTKQFIFHADV